LFVRGKGHEKGVGQKEGRGKVWEGREASLRSGWKSESIEF